MVLTYHTAFYYRDFFSLFRAFLRSLDTGTSFCLCALLPGSAINDRFSLSPFHNFQWSSNILSTISLNFIVYIRRKYKVQSMDIFDKKLDLIIESTYGEINESILRDLAKWVGYDREEFTKALSKINKSSEDISKAFAKLKAEDPVAAKNLEDAIEDATNDTSDDDEESKENKKQVGITGDTLSALLFAPIIDYSPPSRIMHGK